MTRFAIREVPSEEALHRMEEGKPVGDNGDFTYEVIDSEGAIVYVAYSPTEAFQFTDVEEGRV